jgi:predicted cupin superfamily sugar epimerase
MTAPSGPPPLAAAEIIDLLGLVPHPEGGWYRETWHSPEAADDASGRALGTAIYFLLVAGERSHWHRVDAAETWHFYDGSPLELWISPDGVHEELHLVGLDLMAGERPQVVVPPGAWQSATSRGDYTLVGCTVVPGFSFDGFELAPDGWEPHPA